jgi:hypothetical protein
MSRALGTEIYDLAWSPDGTFIISGSMDNIARIYNAQTGTGVVVWPFRHLLILYRKHCSPDCRAQPLCPRRCMGSSERIRSDTILGPIGAYIHPQDQGRPIRAAQQDFENGPPISADIVEQPSPSRLCQPSLVRKREHIPWRWVTNSFSSRNSTKPRLADEPAPDIPQPTIIIWLLAIDEAVGVSRSLTSIACGYAWNLSKPTRTRTGVEKREDLCWRRHFLFLFPTAHIRS